MVICSIDALKKSSKKKKIKMKIAEVLQQASYCKFLVLALHLLPRITLTLIASYAIIGCFQKVNFQEFNLVT